MSDREPGFLSPPPESRLTIETEGLGIDEVHDQLERARKEIEGKEHRAEISAEDAKKARERIAEIEAEWNPKVPQEANKKPEVKTNPAKAIGAQVAVKAGSGFSWSAKQLGYAMSGIFTRIGKWGDKQLKKGAPWLASLIGEAPKSWKDRDEEEKKKKEADAKTAKSEAEKEKKKVEAAKKKEEAELKKWQTTGKKVTDAENLRHEKMLQGFLTPAEAYAYHVADDEVKKNILDTIEKDLPTRVEKQNVREHDVMLSKYMTDAERDIFNTLLPIVPIEGATEAEKAEALNRVTAILAAKESIRKTVEAELNTPMRTELAERNKGGNKKGKGGDGKGKGKGKGGGRGRS